MAKLTEAQKARNKAATTRRNAAYRERRAQYMAAKDAAKSALDASELAARYREAIAALDAEISARLKAEEAVRAQIAALEAHLQEVSDAHRAKTEAARKVRDALSAQYFSEQKARENEIEAQFPDMCGFVSAAGWRSIDDFME